MLLACLPSAWGLNLHPRLGGETTLEPNPSHTISLVKWIKSPTLCPGWEARKVNSLGLKGKVRTPVTPSPGLHCSLPSSKDPRLGSGGRGLWRCGAPALPVPPCIDSRLQGPRAATVTSAHKAAGIRGRPREECKCYVMFEKPSTFTHNVCFLDFLLNSSLREVTAVHLVRRGGRTRRLV